MARFLLTRIAVPLCRPSPEECAEEYAWFRERLADPGLLDSAVGVKVDGAVLLAVPVGGSRRGGYLSVGTVSDAVRVRAALRGLPGFPRVRLNLSVHRDTCHTVNWGARHPWDDAARGRHFGYAPSAIDAFLCADNATHLVGLAHAWDILGDYSDSRPAPAAAVTAWPA